VNKIGFHLNVLITVTLIAALPPALANQERTPKTDQWVEKYTEDNNRENFSGWEGILFYCFHNGKQSDRVLTEICERSYTNANFLATSSKINLTKAQSLRQIGFESYVGNRLILMIDLHANGSQPPVAVAAKLQAYTSYSGPVKKYPLLSEQPQENPRSGTLILWEREAIGATSGLGQDLLSPVSEAIEQMLKQFFADYLNAQR
jgi:hypothetical protein